MSSFCEKSCRDSARRALAAYTLIAFSLGIVFANLLCIEADRKGTLNHTALRHCLNTFSQQ